mgnify:CR=1 FL=1
MSSVNVFIEKNYAIISSFEEDSGDFVIKVNELLHDGWIVSGGVSSSNSKIFQALIKISK